MSNGRALHDAIAKKAALGLKAIYTIWRRDKRLDPFVVVWPLPELDFRACLPTNCEVTLDLPKDRKAWTAVLTKLVDGTEPAAVLVAQQKEEEVLLVLESEYGTTSWHIPIQKHGPDVTLGQPSTKTDADCLGLLWKAGKKN